MIQFRLFTIDIYYNFYLFLSFHKTNKGSADEYKNIYSLIGLEFCTYQATIYFLFFQFTFRRNEHLPF